MKNYLVKGHHSIMRSTSVQDWNNVSSNIQMQNGEIVYPKGASWQKVEDATAIMVKSMKDTSMLVLNRGVNYYKTL